jgi:hypothetical protein
MSKFVRVRTELRDLTMVKQALDDLKVQYRENHRFTHVWSGYTGTLPLVVTTRGATFALRSTDAGAYEAVGDDMQMGSVRALLQQVQQRYAYHRVRSEMEKAGFDLVDEKTGADKVIRLTVRRWADE